MPREASPGEGSPSANQPRWRCPTGRIPVEEFPASEKSKERQSRQAKREALQAPVLRLSGGAAARMAYEGRALQSHKSARNVAVAFSRGSPRACPHTHTHTHPRTIAAEYAAWYSGTGPPPYTMQKRSTRDSLRSRSSRSPPGPPVLLFATGSPRPPDKNDEDDELLC